MTAQASERLLYQGEMRSMCAEPLGMYFALSGVKPDFQFTCTALWRGYIGSWEIIDDRLYLVELSGRLMGGTDANLETLFPGYPDRVFAHWYSGKVRIPQGKLLECVHMGYGSVYENDLFLFFDKGVVTKSEVAVNGESPNPDALEGYGIGAMTLLPVRRKDPDGGDA